MLTLLSACDTRKPESVQEVAVQGVLSAEISRDGSFAVVGSIHHGGSGWDLQAFNRLYNWNHQSGQLSTLRSVALSGDGRRALTVENRDLVVWDTTTGQALNFWQTGDKVLAAALSGDGSLAVLGQQNSQAILFDVNAGAERQVFAHEAEVYAVGISDDGSRVITGADDFDAVLWDATRGLPLHRFSHDNQVKQVAISADGSRILTQAQREKAVIRDAVSGDAIATLPLEYENFTAARFSADAGELLIGTFQGDVYLYRLSDVSQIVHWQAKGKNPLAAGARSGAILSVAFQGGSALALVSDGSFQRFARP